MIYLRCGDYSHKVNNFVKLGECKKMKKNKFIALVGASATGKSTVERILQEQYGLNRCVSMTTRPKRDYEQDGVDYYFVTTQDFEDLRKDGLLAEETCFNSWLYGLTVAEVEDGGVVVIEPKGLQQIIESVGRENVFVVYLTYPDKERLIRSLVDRNDNDVDEVIRRYQADKNDMQNMEWVADITIVNHDSSKTAEMIYKIVK